MEISGGETGKNGLAMADELIHGSIPWGRLYRTQGPLPTTLAGSPAVRPLGRAGRLVARHMGSTSRGQSLFRVLLLRRFGRRVLLPLAQAPATLP